jgi:hypothetical protein
VECLHSLPLFLLGVIVLTDGEIWEGGGRWEADLAVER